MKHKMKQKRKSYYLVLIGIFLVSTLAKAQQDPQFTHYMYNMNVINPAYATDNAEVLNVGGLYRTQWVGAVGAPKTGTLFVHAPLGKKVEMGLSFVSDVIGDIVHENNIYADFAYVLPLAGKNKISFGVKGGLTTFDANLSGLQLIDGPDAAFSENINKIFPNVGVGTYYFSDKYYLGLSSPNLLTTKHINNKNGIQTSGVEDIHYFFTGGYVFDLNPSLKFKPAFMAKGVSGAPVALDLTTNFLINNKVELGVGYRLDDSVSGLVNFYITPTLRIGYSYDYTLSNLGKYNSGSHEIFMLFDIDLSRFGSIGFEKSPRFF